MAGRFDSTTRRAAALASLVAALVASLALAASASAKAPLELPSGGGLADQTQIDVQGKRGGEAPKGSTDREPRIVGGQPIDISQVPWQVAVTQAPFAGNAQQRQFCGASLIAARLVVTAAHCVFTPDGTALQFLPEELSVITGRSVLSSSQGQEIQVQDIFFFIDGAGNSRYNPNNGAWDVALLGLAQPSTTGTPIQIPGPSERELWANGRAGIVTGWGHTRFEGEGSDQLLFAEIYMTRESGCEDAFGGPQFFDRATSICAGVFAGGRDACQGDSGGPFVVPSAQGIFRLAGDVQSGVGCGNERSPGAYGRFGEGQVQTDLASAAGQLTGVNIVGSGLTPPTTISLAQGEDLGLNHAEQVCNGIRKCVAFNSKSCRANGTGVQCKTVLLYKKPKRGKRKKCTEQDLFSADTGTITVTRLGRRTCNR